MARKSIIAVLTLSVAASGAFGAACTNQDCNNNADNVTGETPNCVCSWTIGYKTVTLYQGTTQITRQASQDRCSALGQNLTSIDNPTEWAKFKNDPDVGAWTGGLRYNGLVGNNLVGGRFQLTTTAAGSNKYCQTNACYLWEYGPSNVTGYLFFGQLAMTTAVPAYSWTGVKFNAMSSGSGNYVAFGGAQSADKLKTMATTFTQPAYYCMLTHCTTQGLGCAEGEMAVGDYPDCSCVPTTTTGSGTSPGTDEGNSTTATTDSAGDGTDGNGKGGSDQPGPDGPGSGSSSGSNSTTTIIIVVVVVVVVIIIIVIVVYFAVIRKRAVQSALETEGNTGEALLDINEEKAATNADEGIVTEGASMKKTWETPANANPEEPAETPAEPAKAEEV